MAAGATLDIGCGIGSALLMVAWGLRRQFMEQQNQQQQQQQQFSVTTQPGCGSPED